MIRLAAILLAFFSAGAALAASSRHVCVPAEERLLADVADGSLDEYDLLQAALIAGGIADADSADAVARRFSNWLADVPRTALPCDARGRAQAIFARLHRELLHGQYQATLSDVAVALETGDFNCLSATVLYVCAARHAGLSATGLATDGHVLCEIEGPCGRFEVETTCPQWFHLAQADAQATRQLRLAPAASGSAKPREVRRLTDVELVAKVYYNRGVGELRDSNYELGLKLTHTSLRLDPHDAVARGNVLAGLNNWALALCREQRYGRAAELLAELRALEPSYPTLADNEAHIARAKAQRAQE